MLKYPRIFYGSIVALSAFAIIFLFPVWTHLALLFAVFTLGEMEFSNMVRRGGHKYELLPTTVCGVAYLICTALESPVFRDLFPGLAPIGGTKLSDIVLWVTPAIFLMRGVFRRETDNAMETFAFSYAGFWYVAVLLSFMVRISFEWGLDANSNIDYTGRLALALFIILVKMGDVGAYGVGVKFGRRKLIPEISPKKTVEGLMGGYVVSIITSLVCWALATAFAGGMIGEIRYTLFHALLLPIVLTTAGVVGDLSESLIKRSVGVKDSSSALPGMGGVLDVLDSLLFAAPIMYVYILLFSR